MYFLSISYFLLCLFACPPQEAAKAITPQEAKAYIGEKAKVCGVIASIYEPRRSRRNPTFLNFEKPYPATEFTAVIWRRQRSSFGDLRGTVGKKVCVSGQVKEYRGRVQITLTEASQLGTNPGQN